MSQSTTAPSTSEVPRINISPPEQFLPQPGPPTRPWNEWKSLFDNYLMAAGLDTLPDVRKRALLLHCLGAEGQRIFAAMQPPPSQNSDGEQTPLGFDETVKLLKEQFGGKTNVVAERHRFRQRGQRPGEKIADFVAALYTLAGSCEFGGMTDEMIRDQIVEKVSDRRIRERLLIEDGLTLKTAVTLSQQWETSIAEASAIETGGAVAMASRGEAEVNKVQHQFGKSRAQERAAAGRESCPNCGGGHNRRARCPAEGKSCYACGKQNHFGRMCRSQGTKVAEVGDESSREVFTVRGTASPDIRCRLKVQGSWLSLLVDSGAKVSILSERTYRRLGSKAPLQPSNRKLIAYNGKAIDVLGQAVLSVNYRGQSVPFFCFTVVQQGSDIMGTDLMQKLSFQVVDRDGDLVRTVDKTRQLPAWLPDRFEQLTRGLGRIRGFEHRPRVNPAVPPVAQPLRRTPLSLKEKVQAEIDQLLADGIVEEIQASEWISNLVVVPKPDGKIRICNDLRCPNKAIVPDKQPLPTFEELTTEFKGSTLFSKLDLNSSYLQLELAEDRRDMTAFITEKGLYRYKRVCFGLNSAPAAFQKVLSKILHGCSGTVHYIDDIVVHAASEAEHHKRLTAVLDKLLAHGVTLNAGKCQWAAESVQFLGYIVSASGLRPMQSNVDAIEQVPEPKSAEAVAAFLGMVKFYANFLQNLSDVAEPLLRLLRKDVPWDWSADCQKAFTTLKKMVLAPTCLRFFSPDEKIIVACDSSAHALGAVLLQEDGAGVRRPVAFASRTLSATERKYSASEREALACIFACERWHYFLFGRRFELHTDHQALTTLLTAQGSGHRPLRLHRWADRLLAYDFQVCHVPGKKNIVPDFLSRHGARNDSIEEDPAELQVNAVLLSGALQIVSPSELAEASLQDPVISQAIEMTLEGWPSSIKQLRPELQPFWRIKEQLTVWNEGKCLANGLRAVIPASLREKTLQLAHFGHLGVSRMKQHCRDSVWWPQIDSQIEEFVRHCEACLLSEKNFKPSKTVLTPTKWPTRPWEELQLDIFGELHSAPNSCRFILVLYDLHSKWPEAACMSTVTTADVIDALTTWFSRWGLPKSINTDGGPQFMSGDFKDFLQRCGIQHRQSPHYHPQGNAAVERFNRFLKDGLKTHLQDGYGFKDAVRALLWSYRATPHALTGVSPAELMTSRKISTPLTALQPRTPSQHNLAGS
ncbi:hypothetical protein BOX15_Mlig023350g2, partial [Macrostomum lignano]